MSKTKKMFGKVRKSEQLKQETNGDQEELFSREEKVDPFKTKEEKIGGRKRKIRSLFEAKG